MPHTTHQSGILPAAGAFVLWGLIPIYFKWLEHVPPLQVLAHRVLWSAVLLIGFLLIARRIGDLLAVIRRRRLLGGLLLTSLLIATNWLCFIWGVVNDRILETSLGYYINPLISVLMGFCFFSERLSRAQTLAVGIAAVAVLLQVVYLGKLPWVALVLALSFGFYGVLRKRLNVDAAVGLAVETLLLVPLGIGYLVWLSSHGQNQFQLSEPGVAGLLALAGVITTVPLVLFNIAARRLALSVLGIMQYLAPSISFLVGIFLYNEPLGSVQMMTFGLIWTALVIFTLDGFRRKKRSGEVGAMDTAKS